LTFLASHPQWHTEIHQELENLLASHATQLHDKDAGITAQLASVPLQAWETATPMLDKVIRETLRLAQPHVAMRRNMGPELTLPGGASVPSGSFVVYPFSDVHLDSSLYPEPWRFDPSRPEPKGVEFGYVGWGGGMFTAYPKKVRAEFISLPRQNYLCWPAACTSQTQAPRGDIYSRIPKLSHG
jgi:cytochrome P450